MQARSRAVNFLFGVYGTASAVRLGSVPRCATTNAFCRPYRARPPGPVLGRYHEIAAQLQVLSGLTRELTAAWLVAANPRPALFHEELGGVSEPHSQRAMAARRERARAELLSCCTDCLLARRRACRSTHRPLQRFQLRSVFRGHLVLVLPNLDSTARFLSRYMRLWLPFFTEQSPPFEPAC